MITPTSRQADLLRYVAGYIETYGRSPTFPEMVEGIQARSKSSVHGILLALEERGLIQREPRTARSITLVHAVPVPRAPDGDALFVVKLELGR